MILGSPGRPLLGKVGEALAASFLKRRGYRIVEQNYRCEQGELDIIAEHEGALVFVEVRAKSSDDFGTPLESITPVKQAKLRQVAGRYLAERDLPRFDSLRFDAVGITFQEGLDPRIELVRDAIVRRWRL